MTKNTFKNMAEVATRALVFVVLFAVPYPFRAFILSKLWKWFVVPMFGCPTLGFPVSLAFVLISALVLVNVHKNQGEHVRTSNNDAMTAIEEMFFVTGETCGRAALILFVAYLLHLLGPK